MLSESEWTQDRGFERENRSNGTGDEFRFKVSGPWILLPF